MLNGPRGHLVGVPICCDATCPPSTTVGLRSAAALRRVRAANSAAASALERAFWKRGRALREAGLRTQDESSPRPVEGRR